jgi:16S rRNA (guanine966-N2)-methyltransferase
MRILSGSAKGRRLGGPAIRDARPTTELVRGAIFNILGSLGACPIRVLDLFAGSGSLGIEAISRGAGEADFVERNVHQCARIKENLSVAGFQERSSVYCMDAMVALESLKGPYQLVLMDPPYKLEGLGKVMDALATSGLVELGTQVVVGHSKRVQLNDGYEGLVRNTNRRYGDSVVDFFQREE